MKKIEPDYVWAAVNVKTGEIEKDGLHEFDDNLNELVDGWEWEKVYLHRSNNLTGIFDNTSKMCREVWENGKFIYSVSALMIATHKPSPFKHQSKPILETQFGFYPDR